MLKKYIPNLVKVISIYVYMLKCIQRQKKYIKNSILLDLEGLKKDHDQSLTEKDFERIRNIYALSVPVIVELYSNMLRGAKITSSEKKTATYLGGLAGLFDDFFDEKDTPEALIKEFINNPNIENARNSHERLFIQLYLKALEQKHSDLIKEYFNPVYDAEILSKKQTSDMSTEEILQITEQKGGVSILFWRTALEEDILEIEKKLLLKLGLLVQLADDISDIYKDHQDGIYTLATKTDSITSLRSRYYSILNDTYELIEQTGFSSKNKKRFTRLIAMLAARGIVCINQLLKLESEYDGPFEISRYSRKQLICDMGKLKNNLKWMHLSVLELSK